MFSYAWLDGLSTTIVLKFPIIRFNFVKAPILLLRLGAFFWKLPVMEENEYNEKLDVGLKIVLPCIVL